VRLKLRQRANAIQSQASPDDVSDSGRLTKAQYTSAIEDGSGQGPGKLFNFPTKPVELIGGISAVCIRYRKMGRESSNPDLREQSQSTKFFDGFFVPKADPAHTSVEDKVDIQR
jgi:hypothetical protein